MQPDLSDCRRLFLRNCALQMSIGAHAQERAAKQRVLINVDVYIPLAVSTPRSDALHEVVDYDFIRGCIASLHAGSHVDLQETLCDRLLALLLRQPQVRAARVSTEKPDVYPDCDSVGCEVFGWNEL